MANAVGRNRPLRVGNETPDPVPAPVRSRGHRPVLGKDMPRSFTGFLQTVKDTHSEQPQVTYQAQKHLEEVYETGYTTDPGYQAKTAMNEASGTQGGYTVPPDYSLQLMEVISEESFIYPRAQVIPFETAEVFCPRIDVETVPASAGTSPFFGSVSFSWGLEDAPPETAEPAFRQMSLRAWDLLGYGILSNQFLMDTGPAGEEYLIKLFGKAAAWYAEYAFLQGLGAGSSMPLGILNAPATVVTGGSASQNGRKTANTIVVADLAAMAAHLLPYSWKGAIWAASPTCLAQIVAIANYFINGYDVDRYGNAGNILTRPLFVTEKLASLGTQGDLVLFDPWLYVIGQRQEVVIDVSPHNLFRNMQTVFRVWLRLDGKPQVSKSITLQDKSTVVSPYVVLGPQGT